MRFRLTPRSMTLDDLELYKLEFSENFADQYCQRQPYKRLNVIFNIVFLTI